jgi:hypothetical protein
MVGNEKCALSFLSPNIHMIVTIYAHTLSISIYHFILIFSSLSLPPSPSLSLSLPSLSSLSKEVVVRPYYRDLLEHPLIKEYESKDVDIGEWFRDVNKTIGPV